MTPEQFLVGLDSYPAMIVLDSGEMFFNALAASLIPSCTEWFQGCPEIKEFLSGKNRRVRTPVDVNGRKMVLIGRELNQIPGRILKFNDPL